MKFSFLSRSSANDKRAYDASLNDRSGDAKKQRYQRFTFTAEHGRKKSPSATLHEYQNQRTEPQTNATKKAEKATDSEAGSVPRGR